MYQEITLTEEIQTCAESVGILIQIQKKNASARSMFEMEEKVITVGDFTLTILKENDRHYLGRCSGCGLVTPSKKFKISLEEWFKFHINGFKTTHGGESVQTETTWRIN